MPTLQDAIVKVQSYMATLPGVRQASSAPPDAIGAFPFITAYPASGSWLPGTPAGAKTGLHNIAVEVHVARKNLPSDYAAVVGFCETVPNILMKQLYADQWGGTIQTFARVSYQFTALNYAGVDTLGFRFTIENVKMISAVS